MIDEYYDAIKTIHVTCVALSGSLFAARALWVLLSGRALWHWLRVLPHLIDTLLLASGLTLAFLIHQYPFLNSDWLTTKVIGLIVYIALGVAVFRGQHSRAGRALTGLMALTVFAYIVSVAISKQPAGFFGPYL
ncbi:MAG: SirB2 family protein [Salinisphaera sp.]|uniref:SirB2 family protein n=1 Tax=Salinisphaera sp. TaxID=1914330 RepID=UPI003C7AEED6